VNAYDQLSLALETDAPSRTLPRLLSIANTVDAPILAKWVRLELGGYLASNPAMTEDDVVPEYRAVAGTWRDDFGRMFVLRPDQADLSFVNELRLREGIAELEALATAAGPLSIRHGDFAALLKRNLDIDVSTFEFEPRSVAQVISNVRMHALDSVCEYRDAISAIPVDSSPGPSNEILQLKPGVYGISLDLKALWRRVFKGRG